MIRRILSRLSILFRGGRFRQDLSEEMAFHMDALTADLVRQGMDPRKARREALLRFGSVERVQARSREARGLSLLDEGVRNLRFGVRSLMRSPLHTGIFVATLALCIGLGTGVFSVVDAVLWRPLPYPAPQQLAHAVAFNVGYGKVPGNTAVDGRTWERIRDEAGFLERAVYSDWPQGVNLSTDEASAYVHQQRVGTGFFRTLGVQPFMGREFQVAEDVPGGPPVVILSHRLWAETFKGDPEILGERVRLKGEAHTVVGIMPADFHPHSRADVWTPLRPDSNGEGSGTNYSVLVRIPDGMSLQEADARLAAIEAPQPTQQDAPEKRFGLVPLEDSLRAGVRLPMLILLGAMVLMLVVGCANLAGLQIARSLSRQAEMATRQALGSGSGALVRQMVVENILLGMLGGGGGILLALTSIGPMEILVQSNFGLWQEIGLDGRALSVAFGITLLATLLFGLAPVLQVANPNIQRILVTGSRGVMGSGGHLLRKVLLVGQVAMVTALLFGAGLLVRSYGHLDGLEPGFDPEGVMTVQLSLDDARFPDAESILRLYEESLEGIRGIPGVTSASVTLTLPYERPLNVPFRLPGFDPEDQRVANVVYVTPGFFETLGIPVLRGRGLVEGDRAGSPAVAVVNQAFLAANLEGTEALGTPVFMNFVGEDGVEIVGVVGDVQQVAGFEGNAAPVSRSPTLYVSVAQLPGALLRGVHVWFSPSWIVKAAPGQADLPGQIIGAIADVNADLPTARVASMTQVMKQAFARQRFEALFLMVVAGLALLLAGIGLYGIVAHEVLERKAEMGLRIALGASPGNAVLMAGLGGVRLTAMGLVLGAGLAVFSARFMAHLIYGVSAFDPVVLGALLVILGGLATFASFVPAARIGRLDPAQILREA